MNFKYYFFALAMVGGLLFSACEPKENTMPVKHLSKPDSVFVYSVDANGKETLNRIVYYSYDAVRNNTSILDSIVVPQLVISMYRTDMQYNSKGLMTMKIDSWYYIDKAAWRDVECRVYSYDDNSRLKTEFEYQRYTNPFPEVPRHKLIYTWTDDTHAEVIVYTHHSSDDTTGELTQRLVNTYTSEGKIENQKFYWVIYPNPDNTPDFEYWLTYNQYGDTISIKTYEKGMFAHQKYNKYEYDEQGNILVKWSAQISEDRSAEDVDFTKKCVYYY